MKVIHKYSLDAGMNTLNIPASAQLLDVQTQRGVPCLWVLVDAEEQRQATQTGFERFFVGYCTGQDLPDDPGKYLGTFQIHNGAFVFHLFEVTVQ